MIPSFSPGFTILHPGLLSMLALTALAMLRARTLFSLAMLAGFYSLIASLWFAAMNAPDVAFTEAAVGAGISTSLILAAMLLTPKKIQQPTPPGKRRLLAIAACLITGLLLLCAAPDLPALGDPHSPANSHLGAIFLQRTPEEIAIPNVVTAVLASYRGFDTFGETVVIFTACLAVIMLLPCPPSNAAAPETPSPTNPVSRTVATLMTPILILYAFYVQFHGDYGPGGGFQAGILFSIAIILHIFVLGLDSCRRQIPEHFWRRLAACGVLLYGGTGLIAPLLGSNFLDYHALLPATHGQHLGIWLVELGVMATVSGSMISIFMALVSLHPQNTP